MIKKIWFKMVLVHCNTGKFIYANSHFGKTMHGKRSKNTKSKKLKKYETLGKKIKRIFESNKQIILTSNFDGVPQFDGLVLGRNLAKVISGVGGFSQGDD
jgi:hypothetical protein